MAIASQAAQSGNYKSPKYLLLNRPPSVTSLPIIASAPCITDKVKGIAELAKQTGMTRQGLQKAMASKSNPWRWLNIN
jgi:hypothetical protein